MDFSDFLKYVPKIKQEKLLAEEAHLKMVPFERILEVEKINIPSNNPRKAAVMMLIYPKNKKSHLALIVRNTYRGVHSAQIGFPGGKVEIEDEPEDIKNIKVAGQTKINITSAVNPLQQEPDLDGGSF
jgi:hypothetical protein